MKSNNQVSNFFAYLLIASSATFICYTIFYYFAPVIWSLNIQISPEECAPWVRWTLKPRDGIEIYVLYILLFVTIAVAWLLKKLYETDKFQSLQVMILFILSFFYYKRIGFHMPIASAHAIDSRTLSLFFIIAVSLIIMETLETRLRPLLWPMVLVVLFPFCFISTEPSFIEDTSFIFDPALKLLQGVWPSQIYFQYDLLLSLLAAFWIKLNINPYLFQILGQLSLYVLLISIFFFSRLFFHSKHFSIYLLIALAVFKLYANMSDPTLLIQVTPLRLDLWIILLFLLHKQGPYHWSVALAVGSLVILCRTFGILYFIAYCQLLLVLAAFDFYDLSKGKSGKNSLSLARWVDKQWRLNVMNMVILIAAFLSSYFLFTSFSHAGAYIYLKLGLGFLPLNFASFYWYIPVVFSVLFLFLLWQRAILKERYFHTAVFLLLLAIGQSIYFFGRSHENNLINISAILLLCFFATIDLVNHSFQDKKMAGYKHAAKLSGAFSIFFILVSVYFYQQNIISKAKIQYQNMVKFQFIDDKYSYAPAMDLIRKITHGSEHVYFITYGDHLYYYYGGYKPVGFYSPFRAWI